MAITLTSSLLQVSNPAQPPHLHHSPDLRRRRTQQGLGGEAEMVSGSPSTRTRLTSSPPHNREVPPLFFTVEAHYLEDRLADATFVGNHLHLAISSTLPYWPRTPPPMPCRLRGESVTTVNTNLVKMRCQGTEQGEVASPAEGYAIAAGVSPYCSRSRPSSRHFTTIVTSSISRPPTHGGEIATTDIYIQPWTFISPEHIDTTTVGELQPHPPLRHTCSDIQGASHLDLTDCTTGSDRERSDLDG